MSRLSCEHVDAHKKERGITTYSLIHTYFIACENQESRVKKFRECFCYKCNTRSQRIHACLFCVYFGCYERNHIHEHAANLGHNLAVDTSYGNVYCFSCKDYMYDSEFEQFSRNQKQQTGQVIAQWIPFETVKLLKEDNEESDSSLKSRYLGLRGLVNLGQTCYMNCIVQVLTHNPLLRNYFLAEKHNTKTCHFDCDRSTCLACEMSSLFQEFYSGQEKPHIPSQLVYLMWKHAKHLDGYYPQDAHEFFIKLLDVLHEHMKGKGVKESDHSCECFIHQIFTGSLQSDVLCLSCRNKRTKVESFWDISLDLGAANASGNCVEKVSLNDCLERYTQPEQLHIKCDFCQRVCLSTKQLTVQTLPLVISFHLKRLEFGKKITTLVSFPELLNMTPFISSIRGRASEANGENHYCSTTNGDNNFCLFAVVNHSGDKAGGHYISFIKMQHIWYKCDDEIITVASENDVLVSEGYLLFYHKERIDYKDRIVTVKKEEN